MYRDANGIEHESYTAACVYYGADTPEQLALEAAYDAAEEEADRRINEALVFAPAFTSDDCPF